MKNVRQRVLDYFSRVVFAPKSMPHTAIPPFDEIKVGDKVLCEGDEYLIHSVTEFECKGYSGPNSLSIQRPDGKKPDEFEYTLSGDQVDEFLLEEDWS